MEIFESVDNKIYFAFLSFLAAVFLYDIIQKKHTILHNFPVVGHIRYWLEKIGPELRQYWVANDKEEMPFNRSERRWIYSTAKKMNNNFGFGTTELLYETGYPLIKHAAFPFPENKVTTINNDSSMIPCLKIMGLRHKRKKMFRPSSIINISGMSYGALGSRSIEAINIGASMSHCYHNTGEGGISQYHRRGGNLILQLGTGYFGARDKNGKFSLAALEENTRNTPAVRAIEIKLSQGAKPGKGGILPAAKVNAEIANSRGVLKGVDCISPGGHTEFTDVDEMIRFIEEVAEATGLPVGIKSAVGEMKFWHELAVKMKKKKGGPDFISIDGAEGGTGAAPLSYTDHVAMPFKTAFARVYTVMQKAGLSKDIVWIGSGKLGFPDRAIVAIAMGCDLIQVAREGMMALGCIQAQRCHTGHCPSGIATQNWWLQSGVNVDDKAIRIKNYIEGLRREILSLTHSSGYEHPSQFYGDDIEIGSGKNRFETLSENLGYKKDPVKFTSLENYCNYF